MNPDSPQPRGFQLGLLWGSVSALSILISPLAPWLAERSDSFCVIKALTGVPCPGCGTTRAALALAQLDVAHAFVSFPLQSFAWSVFIVGGLVAGAWSLSRRDLPSLPRRVPKWVFGLAVVLVMANWGYCIVTGV
ncbi:MAG: DUF2752 domain-containing protein [Thermoanaerobaculia bacterium]|nr:DUF2752 domain-containing protein [Thermoanaerobaculia bacterium]